MILDIGIPEIEAIPAGLRVLLGVVQAIAVSRLRSIHVKKY